MTLSDDESAPEKGNFPPLLHSVSHGVKMNTTSGSLPRGPGVDPTRSVAACRMEPAASTAIPEVPLQSPSSFNRCNQILDTEPGPDEPALATVKHEMTSDDDEDVKPPQTKRRCEWHPPLPAPSPDRSNTTRQRPILPSPARQVPSRSPRARAISEAYRPGLRLASALDQNTTVDNAHETYIQATRNVYIATIERLRAREELEEAILELDLFQLELARESLENL